MGLVIAKVSRGWRVGGLLRYLLGPGRSNEHVSPRVMASWDGMAHLHQPVAGADGWFAAAELEVLARKVGLAADAAGIRAPAAVGGGPVERGVVWHCSLRNHASDRVLSDQEWAQVVTDLMDRTGIARRGDLGGARWVAVRHAEDHVHVAAVLVRQDDGRRVHPYRDYVRARQVCQDAEARLGLSVTAAADRTAVPAATRAELEKATRLELGETSRQWLRRAARRAAVRAGDPEQFAQRLADQGVLVRPRLGAGGEWVGYKVAAARDVTAAGSPVWYGGRSLAPDLSLPRLLQRWESAPPPAGPIPPEPAEFSRVGRAERTAALLEATTAIEACTAAGAAGGLGPDVVHAAGDMASAVCTVTAGTSVAVPWTAADVLDRATRTGWVVQPTRWSATAQQLRSAAWRLAASRVGRNDSGGAAALVVALAALVAEIAAYHSQHQRWAQAAAAGDSADHIAGVIASTAHGTPRPSLGPSPGPSLSPVPRPTPAARRATAGPVAAPRVRGPQPEGPRRGR